MFMIIHVKVAHTINGQITELTPDMDIIQTTDLNPVFTVNQVIQHTQVTLEGMLLYKFI